MTNTPNYNLGKPDSTDQVKDFLQVFNDNMDIIDQNMGGGGGGGSYSAGDGIDITSNVISLAYLVVDNGKVCLKFDDGT